MPIVWSRSPSWFRRLATALLALAAATRDLPLLVVADSCLLAGFTLAFLGLMTLILEQALGVAREIVSGLYQAAIQVGAGLGIAILAAVAAGATIDGAGRSLQA